MLCREIIITSIKRNDAYRKSLNFVSIKVTPYSSNSNYRNPYEILGLKSTCSTEDVKKAYIKLCKELHPDMKPDDGSQHKKFVELNNAYTTLIDINSRKRLDNKFKSGVSDHEDNIHWYSQNESHGPFKKDTWQKDEAWYERKNYKEQFYRQENRTINTTRHIKKSWILVGCFTLICIGSLLYFTAYSYATNYTTNTVDEKSRKISEDYEGVRKNALARGKEEQLEKLKKKWGL